MTAAIFIDTLIAGLGILLLPLLSLSIFLGFAALVLFFAQRWFRPMKENNNEYDN